MKEDRPAEEEKEEEEEEGERRMGELASLWPTLTGRGKTAKLGPVSIITGAAHAVMV